MHKGLDMDMPWVGRFLKRRAGHLGGFALRASEWVYSPYSFHLLKSCGFWVFLF